MPVTIIAEAGVNHNGSLEMAKEMARVAKECGADIVKYQTAVPELVVSKFAEKAEYQKQTTDAAESQLEMIRKLHFSFEAHKELKEYCDSIGIQYLSAPFDVPSVKFLGTLGLPLLKIPSGEITNLPYLEAMAAQKTPVLLSTGMSTLDEITDALGVLDDGGCPEVTILHCNTQYPTPYEDANLTAMIELYDQFGLPVGLSDHTPGWECDVAATVLGAQVIEKHFTLDKSLPGPDQKASLDPAEFADGAGRAPRRSRPRRRPQAPDRQRGPEQGHCPQEHCGRPGNQSGRGFHRGKSDNEAPGGWDFAHALA